VGPRPPQLVVVTDANQRGAAAALKSLKRAGYATLGITSANPAAGLWALSSDARRRLVAPGEGAAFAEGVRQSVEDLGVDPTDAALLPASDVALECLSLHRDLLGGMRAGFPSHFAVTGCLEKPSLLRAAAAARLWGPRTRDCWTSGQVDDALAELGSDIVLKPFLSEPLDGGERRAVAVPESPQEARDLAVGGLPVTIQERIRGELVMVGGVMWRGELRCATVFEALRLWPPVTGSASAAVTIAPPEGLLESVTALLADLGWEGPFNLDLLRDEDGRLRTIDLDPRIFATVEVCIRAGADVPAMWCELLSGDDPSFALGRADVMFRWDGAEVVNLSTALRHGRLREAGDILRPRQTLRQAIPDPGPLVARLLETGRRLAG
jgi:carbamoyl-phosphate synthase large subunit